MDSLVTCEHPCPSAGAIARSGLGVGGPHNGACAADTRVRVELGSA